MGNNREIDDLKAHFEGFKSDPQEFALRAIVEGMLEGGGTPEEIDDLKAHLVAAYMELESQSISALPHSASVIFMCGFMQGILYARKQIP